MRWTAYITILITLIAASAAPGFAAQATRKSARSHPASKTQDAARSASTSAETDSRAHSKAYDDGYRQGFAEGRAAAKRAATSSRCVATPASSRTNAEKPASASGRSPMARAVPQSHAAAAQTPDASPAAETPALAPAVPRATASEAHLAMPAPLRGSYTSLQRQNQRLEDDGLERIEDQRDLDARIAHRLLVPLPASSSLTVRQISADRRYCRPWTAYFLSDLARAHQAVFHRPLEVSSAVRTVVYQKRLIQTNGNAAAAEGDVVSPHMTGAAVDLPKDNYSQQELAWMRRYLLAQQQAGAIDVEEEFQQSCFHITVYKSYVPVRLPAAPLRPSSPATAAPLRAAAHPVPGETSKAKSIPAVSRKAVNSGKARRQATAKPVRRSAQHKAARAAVAEGE